MKLLPERRQQISATERTRPVPFKAVAAMFQQHLEFKGVLRRQKARNAFDQAFELFNVKVLEAAKIVKHCCFGKALFAVALVVGKLDVGGF
jgi:hypothetical protein